ncbi:hypothetical protein DAPPUDRAFT_109398 [Daphnia pulex]|uniref:Uncharacterized protein n=1 Tax=Daphnia pulex TaxID=6669 RepID=E9H2X4_DAPPU|nr:hypothetical protein DAPPUDRAFT_109398 [Daphnia pulex]|eukprot:EFX73937.1 hypothetical protein DAPPUDRAFT_109398 [Daphnia pulex]
MTSELDSLCGNPAAKRRNEKYKMNDDELDNFAKVIQQQTDETKDRTNQSNGYSQINEEKIGGTATKIRSNGMIWADQMREHGQRDDNGRTAKNDRGDGVGRTATQKPSKWDDNGRTATQKPARWDVSAEQQNGNTGTRQQKQETARKVTRLVMTMK